MLKTATIAKRPIPELLGNINHLYDRYDITAEWSEDVLVEKLLAIDILKLLPDELIRFGIRTVFGDGRCDHQQAKVVNRFRHSDRAKILYQLWRGKDYQPVTCCISANRHSAIVHYIEVQDAKD